MRERDREEGREGGWEGERKGEEEKRRRKRESPKLKFLSKLFFPNLHSVVPKTNLDQHFYTQ